MYYFKIFMCFIIDFQLFIAERFALFHHSIIKNKFYFFLFFFMFYIKVSRLNVLKTIALALLELPLFFVFCNNFTLKI